jgi:hypothetical protein
MRVFSRPEFMAIPIVAVGTGVIFLVLAAAERGVWAWFVAGALILVGIGVGAYGVMKGREHPPIEDAPRAVRPHDSGVYNVLVLADENAAAADVSAFVAGRAGDRTAHALVVAPALSSRLDRLTGDEQAYEDANRRVEETLQALEAVTESRSGKVGSHDPIQALDEALREFAADEIVVAGLEDDVVGAARERYDVPVTPLSTVT